MAALAASPAVAQTYRGNSSGTTGAYTMSLTITRGTITGSVTVNNSANLVGTLSGNAANGAINGRLSFASSYGTYTSLGFGGNFNSMAANIRQFAIPRGGSNRPDTVTFALRATGGTTPTPAPAAVPNFSVSVPSQTTVGAKVVVSVSNNGGGTFNGWIMQLGNGNKLSGSGNPPAQIGFDRAYSGPGDFHPQLSIAYAGGKQAFFNANAIHVTYVTPPAAPTPARPAQPQPAQPQPVLPQQLPPQPTRPTAPAPIPAPASSLPAKTFNGAGGINDESAKASLTFTPGGAGYVVTGTVVLNGASYSVNGSYSKQTNSVDAAVGPSARLTGNLKGIFYLQVRTSRNIILLNGITR